MEWWNDGRMEGWNDGRLESWNDGRMEGWKDGRMEGWKDGMVEGWNGGRLESWKDGATNSPIFQYSTIPIFHYSNIPLFHYSTIPIKKTTNLEEDETTKKEVTIVIAEDDEGHAALIRKNLKRAGIKNEIVHLKDGQETLDYLFQRGENKKRMNGIPILLLLDIKMPKVDGIEVLRQVKKDPELRKMPVIMITTTDDPREVGRCHEMGCSNYITKPIGYNKFVDVICQLGLFLLVVTVPTIIGENTNETTTPSNSFN